MVLPADLANATIDMIPDHVRTSYPIEPDPVVKLDGRTLVKGVDYEVSYSENVNEGTAMLMMKASAIALATRTRHFRLSRIPRKEKSVTGPCSLT